MGINIGIEFIKGAPTLFTKDRDSYKNAAKRLTAQCIIAPGDIEKADYGEFAIWRRDHKNVAGAVHSSPPDPTSPEQKRLMCIFVTQSKFLNELFIPGAKIDKQAIFQKLFDSIEANMQKANEIRPAEPVEQDKQQSTDNQLISKKMESLLKAIEESNLNSISNLLADKDLLKEAQSHNVCLYAQKLIQKHSKERPISETKVQKAQDALIRIIECGVIPRIIKDLSVTKEEVIRLMNLEPRYNVQKTTKSNFLSRFF